MAKLVNLAEEYRLENIRRKIINRIVKELNCEDIRYENVLEIYTQNSWVQLNTIILKQYVTVEKIYDEWSEKLEMSEKEYEEKMDRERIALSLYEKLFELYLIKLSKELEKETKIKYIEKNSYEVIWGAESYQLVASNRPERYHFMTIFRLNRNSDNRVFYKQLNKWLIQKEILITSNQKQIFGEIFLKEFCKKYLQSIEYKLRKIYK
jgi:hypothetical protein